MSYDVIYGRDRKSNFDLIVDCNVCCVFRQQGGYLSSGYDPFVISYLSPDNYQIITLNEDLVYVLHKILLILTFSILKALNNSFVGPPELNISRLHLETNSSLKICLGCFVCIYFCTMHGGGRNSKTILIWHKNHLFDNLRISVENIITSFPPAAGIFVNWMQL